jgi:hypothetical protein
MLRQTTTSQAPPLVAGKLDFFPDLDILEVIKIHIYILQNILLEPFAKQQIFNNSSVKNKKRNRNKQLRPLGPNTGIAQNSLNSFA